ncbi:hypothetical protein [Methylomonas sp. HYX-M1]|uniref:hypothetical protein n=1 Tax=Methylomonas sp. HYX-M1 TaxID=3139307 RepID=UPI00345C11AF
MLLIVYNIFSYLNRHITSSIFVIPLLFLLIFFIWNKIDNSWFELSSHEKKTLLEYKIETGADYIYCMKAKISDETYIKIIENRKFTKIQVPNKRFPSKCKGVQWWDIANNALPEFSNETTKDSLELIAKINDVIYFTSEAW